MKKNIKGVLSWLKTLKESEMRDHTINLIDTKFLIHKDAEGNEIDEYLVSMNKEDYLKWLHLKGEKK